MNTCNKCGLDHRRLGVEIAGQTLTRSADASRHMLRVAGGAWAFESVLISRHPEIKEIKIVDRGTGELWRVGRSTFDERAFPFNAAGRSQLALALKHWNTDDAPEPVTAAVQLILIPSNQFQGSRFEPARKPRTRLPLRRRTFRRQTNAG